MSHAEEYDRAKSKMLSDFKQAITDAEELREAETSGDGSAADKATVHQEPAVNPGR